MVRLWGASQRHPPPPAQATVAAASVAEVTGASPTRSGVPAYSILPSATVSSARTFDHTLPFLVAIFASGAGEGAPDGLG